MAGDMDIKAAKQIASGPVSDSPPNLSENHTVKEGIPSTSVPPVFAVASAKAQRPTLEQGSYYPATSCYDYCYPGYSGTIGQPDDKRYYRTPVSSYPGVESDNNSLVYLYPGYASYPTGTEYLPLHGSYGMDAFPCYTYDSTYSGNVSTGQSVMGPSSSGKPNVYDAKSSALPLNSKYQQPSNFPKSYQNQALKPLSKLSSGLPSKISSNANRNQQQYIRPVNHQPNISSSANRNPQQYARPVNYQSNGSYRYKPQERNPNVGTSTELTRGPRNNAPGKVERALKNENDEYNLKDFEVELEKAKFYIIKSYSEDDVHKSIKYDVWSSTRNGNTKLDAAFREADAGAKCPIFLFFSVNASGQFVGVAEMVGPVDYSKNMDFWQLDKWSGFFPIKWHIIKDVPNPLFRHIILENNDNSPVTFSRDTQEIGLKQGLEMLRIFKNYAERTSVLDDFNFYENREKSLKGKRNAKLASHSKSGDYSMKHLEAGEGDPHGKAGLADPSTLVSMTKKLSISPQFLKSSV